MISLDSLNEHAEAFISAVSTDSPEDARRMETISNETRHQGFFTEEALKGIAETTLVNITAFEHGQGAMHEVSAERVAQP